MIVKKTYIPMLKQALWLWVFLFSLSPCFMKVLLSATQDAALAKTFNKVRTTSAGGLGCLQQLDQPTTQQSLRQHSTKKRRAALSTYGYACFTLAGSPKLTRQTTLVDNNSPPKYIIYKQLKIEP